MGALARLNRELRAGAPAPPASAATARLTGLPGLRRAAGERREHGIDEDTALFIGPDQVCDIEGSGSVTIIDPEHLSYSSMDRARKNESLSLHDLKLHVLSRGCHFNIHERKPYPPKKRGQK